MCSKPTKRQAKVGSTVPFWRGHGLNDLSVGIQRLRVTAPYSPEGLKSQAFHE